MSHYIDEAGMVAAFGALEIEQLTDRDRAGEIDEAVLARATDEADAIIDGWLAAAGVPTPHAAPYALLTQIAGDIARYRLYDQGATEIVQQRYKGAIDWLRNSAGVRTALIASAAPDPVGTAESSASRLIGDGDLRGFF